MQLTPFNFQSRIDKALEQLANDPINGSMNGAMLLMSQPTAIRNRSVSHPYRQCSLMYYLTGFTEPECALFLNPNNKPGQRVTIFVREKDKFAELWNGRRMGVAEAREKLPVEQAFNIDDMWKLLPDLLRGARGLYFELGRDELADRNVIECIKKVRDRGNNFSMSLHDPDVIASEQRIFKDAQEVERLETAADITFKTFNKIYSEARPGMNEREIYAMIVGEFYRLGADMEAYNSIVAGGDNACILHYVENNQPLHDNTLLLIDAGSQFEYYASDVTRTFPVGKRFTQGQKMLYEVALSAQLAAIEKAVPGSNLDLINQTAVSVLVDGLIDLKLLKGSKEEIIAKNLFKEFYPHSTSHWIGMDVHDVGSYKLDQEHRPLQPGMYFSIEPGLYCDPANHNIPEEFRGIGIRIEDDILITKDGHRVLTGMIPKKVSDLENRH